MTDSTFVLAGRDLTQFVTDWFDNLKAGNGIATGILDMGGEHACMFLIANIGSRAAEESASDEELLLSAAIEQANRRGRETHRIGAVLNGWDEMWRYVVASFDYIHEVGEATVAHNLITSMLESMKESSETWRALRFGYSTGNRPAELAEYEQQMASLDQREIRAARLLDPSIDIDQIVMSMPLDD